MIAVCSGVGSADFCSSGFTSIVVGDGASVSIIFRRVHFGCALMNSTMRLMLSETGVVSRSRNCGRATATCVTVLLTLKNCNPCDANCWLNLVATVNGKYFC